ncbi:MAG: hypothetical protein HYV07_04640 [Deltaproteobacteria bacterium]|nr:hypothetical protein [Deltaproteobacteria bacterium]
MSHPVELGAELGRERVEVGVREARPHLDHTLSDVRQIGESLEPILLSGINLDGIHGEMGTHPSKATQPSRVAGERRAAWLSARQL